MTFDVAFKRLKEKFANVDVTVLEDMAIQITLSDEDCGGTFYAEVKDHVLSVEPYDYNDNDAIIDVTRAALASILDGKTTVDKAVEKGDMSIKGNLEKVAAIKAAIKAPVKKTATKEAKPAVKKAAPKAEKTTVVKAEAKPAVKAEAKPAVKAEAKPAVKAETTVKKAAEKKPAAKKATAKKASK